MKITKEHLHYIYADNNKSNRDKLSTLCDNFGVKSLNDERFKFIEIYSCDGGFSDDFELLDTDNPESTSRFVSSDDIDEMLRAAALEDKTEGDFWAGLESSINEEKPRTKVEYVEVTDSIFDLRPDFEAGELFSKVNHARDYSTINNTQTLAQALHQSCCYRRIETTMTEREAFIEALQSVWVIDGVDGQEQMDKIADSGLFKLVN